MENVVSSNQENIEEIKKIIIEQFITSYTNLTVNIHRIPFNHQIRSIIAQHLDTAYLWAMEGFKHVNFNPPAPIPANIAEKPVMNDTEKNTIENNVA